MASPEDRKFECFQQTVKRFRAKIFGTQTQTKGESLPHLPSDWGHPVFGREDRADTLHLVFCPKHRSRWGSEQVPVCLFHWSIIRESELSPANKSQLLLSASASEVTQEEVHVNLPVQEKAVLHRFCLAPVLDCRCESSSLSPHLRNFQTCHRIICYFKQCQMKFRGWGWSWKCDGWTNLSFPFKNLHLLPIWNPVFSSMRDWVGWKELSHSLWFLPLMPLLYLTWVVVEFYLHF